MRRFWYDAERDRYYRLDREHRAAARAAAAAERARAAREHAAQPCAAPLHVHAPSALLAAQLAPRPGAAAAALRACAVRTCASTTQPAPVGALLPRAPLARRTFRTPLVALGPAAVAAWRAGFPRASLYCPSGSTGPSHHNTGTVRPLHTAGAPGDVLELAPATRDAVLVAVDDRAHHAIAVERHALPGRYMIAEEVPSGVCSRCAYAEHECFYDAQWHPRGSSDARFLALAGARGRVALLHAARGELSLVAAPPPPHGPHRRTASDATAIAWACGGSCSSDGSGGDAYGLYCGLRSGAVVRCDVRARARANGAGRAVAHVGSACAGVWAAAAALGDTALVAAGADGRVALYDTRGTAPPAVPLVAYARPVRDSAYHAPAVALCSAGAAIAAVLPDGTARLWRLRSGHEILRVPIWNSGSSDEDENTARIALVNEETLLCCRADGLCVEWHVPRGL